MGLAIPKEETPIPGEKLVHVLLLSTHKLCLPPGHSSECTTLGTRVSVVLLIDMGE